MLQRRTIYRLVRQFEIEGHINLRPIPGPRYKMAEKDQQLLNLVQEFGFYSARQAVAQADLNCCTATAA